MSYYEVIESELGPLFVGGSAAGVHRIDFLRDSRDERHFVECLARESGEATVRDATAAATAVGQLREYFAGERRRFDLPIAPAGTPFRQRVWRLLLEIPHGETATYGEIANRLGTPDAARAVGAAVGRNPLAVVIPCHRVVGTNGALTGYAGGLDRKRWLLNHEATALRMPESAAAAS